MVSDFVFPATGGWADRRLRTECISGTRTLKFRSVGVQEVPFRRSPLGSIPDRLFRRLQSSAVFRRANPGGFRLHLRTSNVSGGLARNSDGLAGSILISGLLRKRSWIDSRQYPQCVL